MSFQDLFARYREMGAMGPQPSDEHACLHNQDGTSWTYPEISLDTSPDASSADDDGAKKERTSFRLPSYNSSRPFVPSMSMDDDCRKLRDEDVEELLSPSIGWNLGLVKNNNVCKDYYKLTSNVLRTLIVGMKEITNDEISPAWQVAGPGVTNNFPKIFIQSPTENSTSSKAAPVLCHEAGGASRNSLGLASKQQVLSISELRKWLWRQIVPVVNQAPNSDRQECKDAQGHRRSTILDSETRATFARVAASAAEKWEVPCKFMDVTSSEGQASDDSNTMDTADTSPPRGEADGEEAVHPSSTIPYVEHRDSEESEAIAAEQVTQPLLQDHCHSSVDQHDRSPSASLESTSSGPGTPRAVPAIGFEQETRKQGTAPKQQNAGRSRESVLPPRPKSWCIVGGYVRRFPTKHQYARKPQQIENPTQRPPLNPMNRATQRPLLT